MERYAVLLGVLLTCIASARIVATYTVFNHTVDEPAHIGCGMEWLDHHSYRLEPQHPPLARVMTALGPYLAGRRWMNSDVSFKEGLAVIDEEGHYDRDLSLARLGILPFFWVGCVAVFLWGRRHFGDVAGVVALLLFTMIPPVLAHAGLATTDMALTAFVGATFLALVVWAESGGWWSAAVLGLCGGFMVLSKFSCLVFFPAISIAAFAWYWWMARPPMGALLRRAATLVLSAAVAALLILIVYRFSANDFVAGFKQVMEHNKLGHPSYLLGERSMTGFWYYYPVVLAVKTPLPLLLLAGFGVVVCWRRRREVRWMLPLLFIGAILLVALVSKINIGVRHVLPVYIAMSIIGTLGLLELLETSKRSAWAGWIAAAALLWLIGTSALSHPDYLPYTNVLAGDEPERVVADSDLDWGQDMKRLGSRLQALGSRGVYFDPIVIADLQKFFGFPAVRPDVPDVPKPGFHAVSITVLKVTRMRLFDSHPEIQPWPERLRPQERVGKGVLLYYLP